jgi:GAF domain-containing protein
MSESSLLLRSLAALEKFFAGKSTMREALAEVTALATVAVPQAEFAGITMTVDDTPGTWIFTHPDVQRVDRVQYDTGDGPCLDAWRTGEVQTIRSTRQGGSYPRFRQASFEHGILSTISLPMLIDRQAIGALNFYARSEDAFGDEDIRIAAMFAAQAALVLTNARAYWDEQSLDDTLRDLTHGRDIIEQAKGVLMATGTSSSTDATALLAERARRDGLSVREAAAALVAAVASGVEAGGFATRDEPALDDSDGDEGGAG